MVDYTRILQLAAQQVSQHGIADALGCSRNTVASVLTAIKAHGISWEEAASLDETQARRLVLGGPEHNNHHTTNRTVPDFDWVHRELARPGVTLLLLWNEYSAKTRQDGAIPFQYSSFTQQYRTWVKQTSPVMHLSRTPGERIEVDWAGDPMNYTDPATGQIRDGWVFVAAFSYSAYTYVEAFPDMKLGSWIDAHVHAFEYFGGTTRLLIPDNLRTGVTKSDRYEPVLNPTYARMADHYGTIVIPARVRRPRDKAQAEGSVRFIANQIGATLRHRQFIGLPELNNAIWAELDRINRRPFQKREDSRSIVFTRDEKSLLNPLPAIRFELSELRKAKVQVNYHVQVEKNFYSVPHQLAGQTLDVRLTSHLVEVFHGIDRVASHARLVGVHNRYSTIPEHMPDGHRQQLSDWTPGRFRQWAAEIGPACVQVITVILASRKIVEQSYRSCLGVMSLARKPGGAARLESCCAQALEATPSPSYTLVKKIWAGWKPEAKPSASLGSKGFVRGAGYYQNGGQK